MQLLALLESVGSVSIGSDRIDAALGREFSLFARSAVAGLTGFDELNGFLKLFLLALAEL